MSWLLTPSTQAPSTLGGVQTVRPVASWCHTRGIAAQELPDSTAELERGSSCFGMLLDLEQFHFPALACKTDSCYLSALSAAASRSLLQLFPLALWNEPLKSWGPLFHSSLSSLHFWDIHKDFNVKKRFDSFIHLFWSFMVFRPAAGAISVSS